MRRNSVTTARAAVLLEIVFAITLLTAAAGTILSAFDASIHSLGRLRLQGQASDLAVTLLSQVQMGDLPAADDGPNQYEEPLEEWSWEIVAEDLPEPIEGAVMKKVRIIVSNTVEDYTYELAYLVAGDEEDGLTSGSTGPGLDEFGDLP